MNVKIGETETANKILFAIKEDCKRRESDIFSEAPQGATFSQTRMLRPSTGFDRVPSGNAFEVQGRSD